MNLDKHFKIGYDPYYERILFTFGNKTFSYSPKRDGWISQHDYLPDVYFNTKKEFYSCKDNGIYQHNHGDKGNYYDVVFDTIFEFVDNRSSEISKVATGIYIDSSVYDSSGELELQKTFDAYRVFNKNQDTSLIDIEYFDNQDNNPYIGNIRKTKNKWYINDIRDISNIPGGVPQDLWWHYKKRLQEHYQQVQLVKRNNDNERIYLFRTNMIFKESIR